MKYFISFTVLLCALFLSAESLPTGIFSQEAVLKPSGKETFLGKECILIKGDMGKVLVWSGIMMLMDFKMGAYTSGQKATSIKTNVPVEAKYFVIPKNITFSEMPGF